MGNGKSLPMRRAVPALQPAVSRRGRAGAATTKAAVLGVWPGGAWGKVMGTILTLHLQERILQDGDAIASIYRSLGTAAADQVVTRALGELALVLAGLASQIRNHELQSADRQLQKLRVMAENLGMKSLEGAAADARFCLQQGDGTAFAAIWARILRIARRSLNPDPEFADGSM